MRRTIAVTTHRLRHPLEPGKMSQLILLQPNGGYPSESGLLRAERSAASWIGPGVSDVTGPPAEANRECIQANIDQATVQERRSGVNFESDTTTLVNFTCNPERINRPLIVINRTRDTIRYASQSPRVLHTLETPRQEACCQSQHESP